MQAIWNSVEMSRYQMAVKTEQKPPLHYFLMNAGALKQSLLNSGAAFDENDEVFTLRQPEDTGNTFLRFFKYPD